MTADIITMDPPWPYDGSPTKDGAAGKHYKLMSYEDLAALPVKKMLTPTGALLLWTTGPMMPMAIKLIEEWGLHFRNVAYVWVKINAEGEIIKGQGPPPTYTKQNAEYILFASVEDPVEYVLLATKKRRGRPFPLHDFAQAQVVKARKRAHSQKPSKFKRLIEEITGPDAVRVELFARKEREGWHCFGDELDGQDIALSMADFIAQ